MNDQFEQALTRIDRPQPDPGWKSEILSLASAPKRSRRLPILKLGLAACWMVIGALQIAMPEVDDDVVAGREPAPTSVAQLSSLYLLASYTKEIESYD